ncbi:MAG: hypothetical protein JWO15_3389 [Sphingomonadales bacterium]|nr:hypothetical protein [Sphingomonadales bacterium]
MGDAFVSKVVSLCDDDDPRHGDCPICRGDVSPEFVAMIEAAADQPGEVMTADEAILWLRQVKSTSIQ